MRQLNEYKNAEINMKISLKRCRKKLGVTEREKKESMGGERKRSKCVCFENKFDIQLTKPLLLAKMAIGFTVIFLSTLYLGNKEMKSRQGRLPCPPDNNIRLPLDRIPSFSDILHYHSR